MTKSIQDVRKLRAYVQVEMKINPKATYQEIAKKLGVSTSFVYKWAHRDTCERKQRKKKKLPNKIKSYIKKTAGDKLTGREGASSRIMAMKLFRKFKIKRTAPTVNKWLNTVIGKPKKGRRTFLLREKDRGMLQEAY